MKIAYSERFSEGYEMYLLLFEETGFLSYAMFPFSVSTVSLLRSDVLPHVL